MTVPRQNVTNHAKADARERHHLTESTFVCSVRGCGRTFKNRVFLRVHLRSHIEKSFKCMWPGCYEGFERQHDCQRHEQLHLIIRPYICHGCQRAFATINALNQHCEFRCLIIAEIIFSSHRLQSSHSYSTLRSRRRMPIPSAAPNHRPTQQPERAWCK